MSCHLSVVSFVLYYLRTLSSTSWGNLSLNVRVQISSVQVFFSNSLGILEIDPTDHLYQRTSFGQIFVTFFTDKKVYKSVVVFYSSCFFVLLYLVCLYSFRSLSVRFLCLHILNGLFLKFYWQYFYELFKFLCYVFFPHKVVFLSFIYNKIFSLFFNLYFSGY